MQKIYFGTDGIRGTANKFPMNSEVALKVGMAAGTYFGKGEHRHKVVIGKDTRLSGYMVEPALTSGFIATGIDVFLLGPMPTPAVAMLTKSLRADFGVMISASHNQFRDNGIKIFDRYGVKLCDKSEMEIENIMQNQSVVKLAAPDKLGRAKRLEDASGRYIEFIKNTFPKGKNLAGIKIVLDCANGAAYKIGPTILWELEAELTLIGCEPNGFNINENCGSTSLDNLIKEVTSTGSHLGIALDGDADRVIFCDEHGNIIDGDQLLALITKHQIELGTLKGDGIVATSMSNMGLENYINSLGLNMYRTDVGDRYVSKYMRDNGYNVGGEQSGHIILSDFTTTGDGLMTALQVLAVLIAKKIPASKLFKIFAPFPQKLDNIRFKDTNPLEKDQVKEIIAKETKKLNGKGRILVRKSGTEPLIRIMVEAEDLKIVDKVIKNIGNVVMSNR